MGMLVYALSAGPLPNLVNKRLWGILMPSRLEPSYFSMYSNVQVSSISIHSTDLSVR
jgi:hypothetical protein